MDSLALNTPGLLFGAYICCIVTLAGFVLNSVPRNVKVNRVSFVYLGLAAASSFHILFCEGSYSPNDQLSPSNEAFQGCRKSFFLMLHLSAITNFHYRLSLRL